MTYERVPFNVAAQLTQDEAPILDHIGALAGLAADGALTMELRREIAVGLYEYLKDRLARGIPNEGRPLPEPYVRLPQED